MNRIIDTIKNQLSIKSILIDSTILCALLGLIVAGSLYYNAEIWLHDYPPEIQAAVGPKSAEAETQTLIIVIPMILIMVGIPLYSNLRLKKRNGGQLSFWTAFINVFLISTAFNLFDLLFLDAWFTYMTPKAWIIPGTAELMKQYNTFAFHATGAAKGLLLSLVFSLILAFITIKIRKKTTVE